MINGVLNPEEAAKKMGENVSNAHGNAQVDVIHLQSYGFVSDILECALAMCGFETNKVRFVRDFLKAKLADTPVGETYKLILHSKAGIVFGLAQKFLTNGEKAKLDIETYGAAKMITDKSFHSTVNYVSTMDPVPFIGDSIGVMSGLKRNDGTVKLLSPEGFTLFDHGFAGSTYSGQLKINGDNYIDSTGANYASVHR